MTFDDGPNQRTAEILDILKTEKAAATFFCIGSNIATQGNILKRIDSEGHLIGTHSLNHHWSFPLQGKSKIVEEIKQSQNLVSDIIHKKPLLFRPPFGVTDPPLAAAIRDSGVSSIGWSVRSYDTVISSAEQLFKRISKLKNGDIVLFHDAGLQTNVILPMFIKYVRSQGFEIVPLDQLLGINAYEDQ
jgi:peptidoglycan/xylan/chitin deacetylase (PgdA/CDA1 family)